MLKIQEDIIKEFDDSLWNGTVEFITVSRSKEITDIFRNGMEVQM